MDIKDYYDIQSSINNTFRATVYPLNVYKGGSGWSFYMGKNQALTLGELRRLAGNEVADELLEECRALHMKENHHE